MASTYKMFLAFAAYHLNENNQLDLSTVVYGSKTIDQCVQVMIVYSDNDCAIAIGRKIGWARVTQIVNDAGFTSVFMNNYDASGNVDGHKLVNATDEAKFLMQLSGGSLMSNSHTQTLLGHMRSQIYRDGIPAGSHGSVVADKVGWLDGVYYHDAGIVYSPGGTYALVVLTENAGWSYIRDAAEAVYEFMN